MREEYIVKLRRPEGVSIAQMESYLRTAILQYHWTNPIGNNLINPDWKQRGRNSVHVKKK
jgi:hypothetical protein